MGSNTNKPANRQERRAAEKAAQEPGASQETKQEAAAEAVGGASADEQSQEEKQHAASERAGTAESSSPPAKPISAGERPATEQGHVSGAAEGNGGIEALAGNEGSDPAANHGGDDRATVDAGTVVNDSDGSADGVTDPDGNPPGNEAPAEPFEEEQDEAEVTPNVLAAAGAASMAYGTDIRDLRVDVSWLRPIGGNRPSLIRRANVLAKFIRDNPNAPYHAGVIHLQRNGFPEVPDAEPRGLVAYQVFATTLNALDRIDADAARAAEPKSDGKPAPIFADAGGMMPETGGLTAGGYGSL